MATPQQVIQGLLSRGLSEPAALGLAGNFAVESGFNPGINEIKPVVPGSRGGFGLAQWTGPRRKQFEQFAAQRGTSPDDLDTQLDFTLWELQNTEKSAGQALQGVNDPVQAARIVSEKFLRPGVPHLDRRINETRRLAGQNVANDAMRAVGREPIGGNQMEQRQGLLSTQGQPEQEQQQPGGIRGLLSNPDVLDRLAIGLTGMTLNPNQGVIQSSQQAIAGRQKKRSEDMKRKADEQARNATVEWLKSQPDGEQFVGLVDAIGGGGALQTYMQAQQAPKDQRTSGLKEYEAAVQQGFDGSFLDYKERLAQAGRDQTNVNTQVGSAETEFQKTTGKALATEASDVIEQAAQAQRGLQSITTLDRALENAPSGALGSLTNMAANIGIKTEGSSDIELANSIISQLIPQQRPPGSGTMSDADLEMFKQSLPRLINTKEGNRKIIDTMRGIAEYDIQRGQIARELQLGRITPDEAFEQYNSLGNPVAEFAREGGDATSSGTRRMRFNPETNRLEPVE